MERCAIVHFICAIVNTFLLEGLSISVCLIARYINGIFIAYLLMYETNLIVFALYDSVQHTICTGGAASHIG